MIRFYSREKKPTVWSVLWLSVALTVILVLLQVTESISLGLLTVVLSVYLVLILVIFAVAFVHQLQYSPYSYNTIYYSGFGLLTLAVLFFVLLMSWRLRQQPDLSQAVILQNMLAQFLYSAHNYMLLLSPVVLIFSILLCISNLSLIRHEGRRVVNLLGILLGVLMVGGIAVLWFWDYYTTGSMIQVMLHDIATNLFAAFYLYYLCMVIGTCIASWITVHYEPSRNKAYLVVLGCGFRADGTPTPLLAGRLDRALEFYHKQIRETGTALRFVTSGGQGADEPMSESAVMKNYLLSKGVPEEHILEEDRSTNTYENMKFSRAVMEAAGEGPVVYSTTNYHVFRSGIMARRNGLAAEGIGAPTKWYFWPNALVREFVGILTEHRLKQGLIIGGMAVLYVVGTIMNYMLGG